MDQHSSVNAFLGRYPWVSPCYLIAKHLNMIKLIRTAFHSWFGDAASIASIAGLIGSFIFDKYSCIIALSSFCVILMLFIVALLFTLNTFIKQNWNEDYRKISSFYVYQTDDGIHSTFETFRLIQCKRAILSEIDYKFKWTGTIFPVFSSENQDIHTLPPNPSSDTYDKAIIRFKKPLVYNETAVVHLKSINDDADGKAKPWLECKLNSPIEFMQFRILLAYKEDNYNKHAIVKRKRLNTEIDTDFEIIGSVAFNQKYKQYFYIKVNPEAGYLYRIEWEK